MSLPPYQYIRDPSEIYKRSFETVRRSTRLESVVEELQPLAIRLVHACGITDIVDDLSASPGAFAVGAAALNDGACIFADSEMVAHGITRSLLPRGNDVCCTLNAAGVPQMAVAMKTTRSAAAVRLWQERIAGSVVAIGNAPTALFHLLEQLHEGWPKPALILGFPVGFIGAAESKQALAENGLGVPYITLLGTRGGSAMAAAAVNALAGAGG